MAYGLQIINPGTNELVISSQGKGVYCLGKGVLTSLVQPSGNPADPSPGFSCGYGIYHFTGLPPFFILGARVGPGYKTAILEWRTIDSAAGIYDIVAYHGRTPGANNIDTVQDANEIWAFAPIPGGGRQSQWGLALYDSSGALSYDFTRPYLLSAVQYIPGAGLTGIPALSKPVMLGMAGSAETLDSGVSFNRWAFTAVRGCWRMPSSTQIQGDQLVAQRYEYTATEPRGLDSGSDANQAGFLIEGAFLP